MNSTTISDAAENIARRAAILPSLADAASTKTLAHFRRAFDIADKSDGTDRQHFDPVTVADREAEAAIRQGIEAAFPEDRIIGEEFDDRDGTSDYSWVIDPIDGTRAYVCGAPTWGTLIAVMAGNRSVAGMMDQPFTRERFIGWEHETWYKRSDDAPVALRTSQRTELSEAYFATTAPELFAAALGETEAFATVRAATKQVRYGLDCYAYCLVASGTIDVVVEAGLNSYDIAALVPIIEGAGGIVTTWSGAAPENGGQIAASANAALHEQLLDHLRSYAGD